MFIRKGLLEKCHQLIAQVYRDVAAYVKRCKLAVYTALVFDAAAAQPYLESKERLPELAHRLADRFLPPGRLLPSPAEGTLLSAL